MKKYNFEQYVAETIKFNKLSFIDKIRFIQNNNDVLTLASDGNWWGVKVKDEVIQEELYDNDTTFNITNEWDSNEINDLVYLLGIDNTDI